MADKIIEYLKISYNIHFTGKKKCLDNAKVEEAVDSEPHCEWECKFVQSFRDAWHFLLNLYIHKLYDPVILFLSMSQEITLQEDIM